MNIERYNAILKQIIEHPETWDQENWHCGTAHCVAGWAEIHSYKGKISPDYFAINAWDYDETILKATRWLKLSDEQGDYLFDFYRTIQDLIQFGIDQKVPE